MHKCRLIPEGALLTTAYTVSLMINRVTSHAWNHLMCPLKENTNKKKDRKKEREEGRMERRKKGREGGREGGNHHFLGAQVIP